MMRKSFFRVPIITVLVLAGLAGSVGAQEAEREQAGDEVLPWGHLGGGDGEGLYRRLVRILEEVG